jgi:SAM-dependent methyltransferase
MAADAPFDRRLRRLRRGRAAHGDDTLAGVMAAELLARLEGVSRRFTEALVIGCEPRLLERLRALGMSVTAADPGFELAAAAGGVQCDEDRLPFADGCFDLVLSAGMLDGVNDLPGALELIRRILRADGLFLAAFAAAGSLPHLRAAMLAADAETGGATPRIHPQIDVRAAGDLLTRAGFALPVADVHALELRYSGLPALVGDLRAAGLTNVLAARSLRPLGRRGVAAAMRSFRDAADRDGRISERLEIVTMTGWAPSATQPKPARPGSGSHSLASVLRPPADR